MGASSLAINEDHSKTNDNPRGWPPSLAAGAIKVLRSDQYHGFATAFHDPLRTLGANPAKQLAEAGFGLVQLPLG